MVCEKRRSNVATCSLATCRKLMVPTGNSDKDQKVHDTFSEVCSL